MMIKSFPVTIQRCIAARAERGIDYCCPDCKSTVFLKRGEFRIAHFAHQAESKCGYSSGETYAHLYAKEVFRNVFASRGLPVQIEVPIHSHAGDRRADVVVQYGGRYCVFELQHSKLSIELLQARVQSYASAGLPQMWIPFLHPAVFQQAERLQDHSYIIRGYGFYPWEAWVRTFHFGSVWFYNPKDLLLWHGRSEKTGETFYHHLNDRMQFKKVFTLRGPFNLEQLQIKIQYRKEFQARFLVPACWVMSLQLA